MSLGIGNVVKAMDIDVNELKKLIRNIIRWYTEFCLDFKMMKMVVIDEINDMDPVIVGTMAPACV